MPIIHTRSEPSEFAVSDSGTRLIQAISRTLARFVSDSNPEVVFGGLLEAVLNLTESEYGFIGEVFTSDQGRPYIECWAVTNVAWSDETRRLFASGPNGRMVFAKLDTLYGAVLTTEAPVISNRPAHDVRRGGVPQGHPELRSFLGLPFRAQGRLQGMVGIANRPGGYDSALVTYLDPFLATCSSLILACRNNVRRLAAEQELQEYKRRIAVLVQQLLPNESAPAIGPPIQLAHGYVFRPAQAALYRNSVKVDLTHKECRLFHALVTDAGRSVVARERLEEAVWQGIQVSESSLRALVLRLRKKLPGLEIQSIPGIGYALTPGPE